MRRFKASNAAIIVVILLLPSILLLGISQAYLARWRAERFLAMLEHIQVGTTKRDAVLAICRKQRTATRFSWDLTSTIMALLCCIWLLIQNSGRRSLSRMGWWSKSKRGCFKLLQDVVQELMRKCAVWNSVEVLRLTIIQIILFMVCLRTLRD
jgi:hypothetical protein